MFRCEGCDKVLIFELVEQGKDYKIMEVICPCGKVYTVLITEQEEVKNGNREN